MPRGGPSVSYHGDRAGSQSFFIVLDTVEIDDTSNIETHCIVNDFFCPRSTILDSLRDGLATSDRIPHEINLIKDPLSFDIVSSKTSLEVTLPT